MNKKLNNRLKKLINRKIRVDFTKSGIIGSGTKGILKNILGDFVELKHCCPGSYTQLINLKEVNNIEIIENE